MIRTTSTFRGIKRVVSAAVALVFSGASVSWGQPPGFPTPPSIPQAAPAQTPAPAGEQSGRLISVNLRDAPLDQVLDLISSIVNRTIIKSPGVNATITLKGHTRLTEDEALIALESALAMSNITLVPMGDKFLRVVQTAQARQEGMPILFAPPEEGFRETDTLVSQIINLRFIEIAEAQGVIQGLLHGYGKIQPLERANSLMVTDTESNLARVLQIIDFIDQPVESKIETRIYEIRYARAPEIASRLNELIADSQEDTTRPQIAVPTPQPGQPQIPTPPGVIRPRQPTAPAAAEIEAAMQLAERGIITGKVRIIADERTNILFVISRAENYAFFDKIVDVLDRPVEPEIAVRVVALEYAKAEDISGILNEFIGAASQDASQTGGRSGAALPDELPGAGDARSTALRDFIRARAAERTTPEATPGDASSIGRLSADTRILADNRTNTLLLMGRQGDLNALEDIIDHLDIMLAQVVIEAIIIEVGLSDDVQSGIDWLQRSMVAYNQTRVGPGGGITINEPVLAFGGGSRMGAGTPRDASTISTAADIGTGGLTYFTTLFDFNLDAVIRMVKNSRNSRILSTPVIVTTDNTEASINASTQRPVVTTTSTTDGGSIRSSYEYRDIGINLTVTPRINPQRYVVMEISQNADDIAGEILIDGNLVPEITTREFSAEIAVEDRSTIILGGLIQNRQQRSSTKIPFLGDIPVLGKLFRFDADVDARTELIVLITPYVLMTPAEARAESKRLLSSSEVGTRAWPKNWSDNELMKMTPEERRLYIENWEELRPRPYARTLSVDVTDREGRRPKPDRYRRYLDMEPANPSPVDAIEVDDTLPAVQEEDESSAPDIDELDEPLTIRMTPTQPVPAR